MDKEFTQRSVAVYGAGAIGLDLSAALIEAGHSVTVIARGQTLEALRDEGFVYRSNAQDRMITPDRFRVVEDTSDAGTQDYVFLTLRSDALLEVSFHLQPLFHQDTVVVSATNGIPPWYSYLQNDTIGRFPFTREPRKQFLSNVEPERIVAAIIERSVNRDGPSPLVVTHTAGTGYKIGELDHQTKERTGELQQLLQDCGLTANITDNIHRDIWKKLLGNICVNPLSVITGMTIGEMLDDPQALRQMTQVVEEAHRVGLKLGVIQPGDFTLQNFLAFASDHLQGHETSMLQAFKTGRDIERHRIVDVVIMLAELEGMNVPVPELKRVCRELQQKVALRARDQSISRPPDIQP